MLFPPRNRMAAVGGGIVAAGCSFALAVPPSAGPGPDPSRAIPLGALERAAPAILYTKPGPEGREDAVGAKRKKKAPAPTTAAKRYGWGSPIAYDGFRALDRRAWEVYTGAGHNGEGRRLAGAVTVRYGVLRITGTRNGDTGGLAWMRGAQQRGRWEARVKVSRGCSCYNANLLLWPVNGGGGTDPRGGGGEIDWMETYGDRGLREGTNFFLHHGPEDDHRRKDAHIRVDLRNWHVFAVEWNARGVSGYLDGRRTFHTSDRAALPPGKMGQAIQLDWFPGLTKRTRPGISRTAPVTLSVDWIAMYRP